MWKGKSVIELTDVHTDEKEVYEDTNLVTNAMMDILNRNICGMLYDNTSFNGSSGDSWMLPLKKNLMGGILLYQNEIEENTDTLYAPLDNPIIGYASDDANNTEDVKRGSRNLTESKEIDGGFKFVWDFQTSQANGTISAICMTNTLAGKGTKYADNYMVRIGTWSTNVNSIYKNYLLRDNKRTFIEAGYRLEMTTFYNSDTATLRRIKNDYLHASLVTRPMDRYVVEPEEEITIKLGHYPLYYHYIGGSKDGTDEPYSTSMDIRTYLYHGTDGKWYGLVRRDNHTYSYTSGGKDYYNHSDYEWFMDTIDGNTCKTQKVIAPSGISDFTSIGMSGKWLMCYTGNYIYRIDTTNVANIELVQGVSYNSSVLLTYIVDDDIVINGWLFKDGEPKLYIRESSDSSYVAWGRGQMARHKTYMLREWMYRYNEYIMYKELYLFTPYLATINNLGSPVIKTADKTMKITYTITEE
jgi:hypothetical protein